VMDCPAGQSPGARVGDERRPAMDVMRIESVPEGTPQPVGTTETVAEAEDLEPTIVLGRE